MPCHRLQRAILCSAALAAPLPTGLAHAEPAAAPPTVRLAARLVAVGLPAVAGLRQAGRFHHGGPMTGNPEFLLQTGAGRVLDPRRLLVATGSNFGAPPAATTDAPGTVLSIDPDLAQTIVVPPRFAAAGGQASAQRGAVQVYSAQSAAFLNSRHHGSARTAGEAASAGPRYLSVNNAFGRVWIANAPRGPGGPGSVSVDDPDGAPLANAPSDDAGGVFAGTLTDRRQAPRRHASTLLARFFNYAGSGQLTPGSLRAGALGTAFLGASPDGTGLAVFAVATADGAIAQVHVQDGVDGLAPPGSIRPGDDEGGVIGMAFKWNPERVLYVADAGRNRVLVLHLDDDGRHFRAARTRTLASPWLDRPTDIAATVPEIANPGFASHTTLAGGSDLYVANRGDGSVVRLSPDGTAQARAVVVLPDGSPLAPNRLRAIAVSADAQRLWLTVQGEAPGHPGRDGFLLEVAAFDAGGAFGAAGGRAVAGATAPAAKAADRPLAEAGERAFAQTFTPETGLGRFFNERSCVACHPGPGGSSGAETHFARRIARMDPVTGRVVPVDALHDGFLHRNSIGDAGHADAAAVAAPRNANVHSLRMPLALFASGAIERIADAEIQAQAVSKGDGIKGRVHYVAGADGGERVGRYGWKADVASLDEMVADAFFNEMGMGSAPATRRAAGAGTAADEGDRVRAVSAYLRRLAAPAAGAKTP